MNLLLDESLIAAHAGILVAVSGGADSVALLRLLCEKSANVVVAHIHHGLRADESDADEQFVRELSTQLQIPFVSKRVHVSQKNGHFSEEQARTARYAALLELAQDNNCSHIATGHTADDNLETVLLQLLRAATVDGLGGIRPHSTNAEKTLIRPLWKTTRVELRDYLKGIGQSWREDSSNASTHFTRNHLRHEAIPLLAQVAKRSPENLARQWTRASQLWRDDVEYLEQQAQAALQNLTLAKHEHFISIDGPKFRELPVALQRRVLRQSVREVYGAFYEVKAEHAEEVRRQVAGNGRRMVWQWQGGIRLEWTGAMAGNRIRVWKAADDDQRKKPSGI